MSGQTPRKKYDHLVKLLLIGDSGVGKSCLLLRFADSTFTSAYITTIGIDFKIKNVEVGGKRVKLQVWDTAGQERFRTITKAYYKGAQGILMVFDVSNEDSFVNVTNWMEQIKDNASEGVKIILLANKVDVVAEERVVSKSMGEQLAAKFGVKYFETSAKDDHNVGESFLSLTTDILDEIVDDKQDDGLKLGEAGGGGGGCC
mmetsp:Transcript_8902/g.16147  ORF Transcript_8902/g.16147 Transcript_8902/m.16147 type:complete len:202 (-) Transcript_8902:47-652(-)|eukprot:CAMPEP_0182493500 /NCGR_PEP_ID=MMETSP1321-20130603/2453_1 /TAXON_ID=91990 /ORGANISM="Bolidomonas sp., Strain RCC1657" /LENGTH=201 /DNA_ID=CAMNT_0024696279 /DNA_START=206 /DNA_END=811 /DNA_ORIENTATION=-